MTLLETSRDALIISLALGTQPPFQPVLGTSPLAHFQTVVSRVYRLVNNLFIVVSDFPGLHGYRKVRGPLITPDTAVNVKSPFIRLHISLDEFRGCSDSESWQI